MKKICYFFALVAILLSGCKGETVDVSGIVAERDSIKFVRVDIRQLRELTLNSKKPKILTTMPQSSYSIVRNSDGISLLTINDPTLFWSSSNYLVISLD